MSRCNISTILKKFSIVLFLLLFNHIFEGQVIFPNGWFQNEGNVPPSGPNLAPQGFGSQAAGASVGDPTFTVTNTNTSGAGSLNDAIFNAVGGTGSAASHKKIVFSIAGAGPHVIAQGFTITALSFVTIDGAGEIIVLNPPNTCVGEPCGDAISLENVGAHHIIVKNLNFTDAQDGINCVDGAHDITIMNCAAWANWDGNIDIASDSHNITIQYNVIGNHNGATGGAGGTLVTGYDVSVHHNLYNVKSTDEGERAPFIHGNYSNAFADVRNNIVYQYGRSNATGSGYGSGIDWGGAFSGCGCYSRANFVNNYYYTPSTVADQDGIDLLVDGQGGAQAYSAGNVSGNGFNFNTGIYTNHAEWSVVAPYQIASETTCEAVTNVLAHVGPDIKHTSVQAIIDEVTQLGSCAFNYMKPFLMWNHYLAIIPKTDCWYANYYTTDISGYVGRAYIRKDRLFKTLNKNTII